MTADPARALTHEGPPLERLLQRIAESPADFLAEPRVGRSGRVHVDAVVGDLVAAFGTRPDVAALAPFASADPASRNALSVTLLLCWLLADVVFADPSADELPRARVRPAAGDLLSLLDAGARALAAVPARRYVDDPDRREELARVALTALGMRPAGETQAQAEDRLASVSSTERARVMAAARDAERRARAIREALQRKAAEESADKFTRE